MTYEQQNDEIEVIAESLGKMVADEIQREFEELEGNYRKDGGRAMKIHQFSRSIVNRYGPYINALRMLVDAKREKDLHGKTEMYRELQPQAWNAAMPLFEEAAGAKE